MCLLLHVINLQHQDGEAIDSPCRTLCVDGCIRGNLYILVFFQKETVDQLHQIGTILVGLVDASLDGQCLDRINLRIPDNVFQMPLHGIDPVFQKEVELDTLDRIGIMHGGIYMIRHVIGCSCLFK